MSKIDTLRKKIAALQAERDTLNAQKRSRSEVAAMLDSMVTQWATAGQSTLSRELQRATMGGASEPLTLRGVAPIASAPGAVQINLNVGPLLVVLLGQDAVKAALIASLGTLPEGMPSVQRLERLSAISAELDRLETEEEALVEAHGIERRTDARPEIVLAVA